MPTKRKDESSDQERANTMILLIHTVLLTYKHGFVEIIDYKRL